MNDLPEAFYLPVGDAAYEPTRATESPWDSAAQHGGPPAALLAEAIDATIGPGMRLARISVDFLGPIPRRPLQVVVTPLRPGRQVRLTEAQMIIDGRPAVTARAWHIATGPTPPAETEHFPPPALPPAASEHLPPIAIERLPSPAVPGGSEQLPPHPSNGGEPLPSAAVPSGEGGRVPPPVLPDAGGERSAFDPGPGDWGYGEAIEWRFTHGGHGALGPARVWTRVRIPLIAGRKLTGLARTLVVADSANGLSATLPIGRWLSIPPTMTTTLLRVPDGEWVYLDCRTHLADDGLGLAHATVSDPDGYLGEVAQPLLIRER
jgi:Acyl-CoA thioesterase C-terminal domain/Acyl-CoA thioesterase N-terminal domain